MDQYDVEKFVGPCGGAVVVFLLISAATDEDIAQAAHDERACFFGAGRLQQRQDLVGKFLSSEREELDEHRNRAQVVERDANHFLAAVEGALDGDALVVTDELICIVDSKGR